MRVFVTDGGERASLAIARSLGRRGIEVHSGEHYRLSTSSLSKYVTKSVVHPDPQQDCHVYINWLEDFLAQEDYDAIFASREITTLPISYNKKRLEKYTRVPYPDYDQMILTQDKARTFQCAIEAGIPVPKTIFVESMEELDELADEIEYPVVVKSRSKTLWKDGKPFTLKVMKENYVDNKAELAKISSWILERSGKMPLIQEYIPGEGYGVEMLLNHGDPRVLFMHKRLREYPITGGVSTMRESIYAEELKEPAIRLMKKLRWHGVAMVEFKVDSRDGIPKLMEVNGRFWGSLALPVAAKVDFPYYLHTMILEGDVAPRMWYPIGVRCRWLVTGDLLWLMSSLKNGRNKVAAVREFLRYPDAYDDILSLDDPLPILGTMWGSLRGLKYSVKRMAPWNNKSLRDTRRENEI
jgi:predicted ATP-grasp superfamily ATP-dependent carboligase